MQTAAKTCFVGESERRILTPIVLPDPSPAPATSRTEPSSPLKNDVLAGLPGRAEAETIIREAIVHGLPTFAAVFLVDRVNVVNDCFGYALGDRLLLEFHDQLKANLPRQDSICRWSGACFVALLERRTSLEKVEAEIRHLVAQETEITIALGPGSLILAAAANWAVFPLDGSRDVESLASSIDFYVARNLGR
jgi:diguanylate cyclase (GGDEF)-like protein